MSRKPMTSPARRNPDEIREYEGRVWDLTRNLLHPAFLYVVCQITLWCALQRNPAFRGDAIGFWEHTLIHALQFLGAWGVVYGTLLRDMRFETRVVTLVLWATAAITAAAWLWPRAADPAAARALRTLLIADLAVAVAGWVALVRTWVRARARHEAAGEGAPRA